MRAQVLTAWGGPENFHLVDIPRPEIRPGMVLVHIAAASINQVDTKIRTGLPKPHTKSAATAPRSSQIRCALLRE